MVASNSLNAIDTETTIAQELAAFAIRHRDQGISAEVAHAVRRQVLDALGVAGAAEAADAGAKLRQLPAPAPGPSSCFGTSDLVAASDAAMRNATLIHGLDFDDTYQPGIVHVGAVVIPTALAVGEATGASDEEVSASIAIGYELHTRLGEASAGQFHARGFHATPVCGVVAAAVVAGLLRGFSAEQLVHAMGIAGSFSGGLQQFLDDGADTKRLHPGWAAQGGIAAADFAAAGFAGPAGVLEGRCGLYATHVGLDDFKASVLTDGLGETWNVARMSIKPYPCCHLLHASIDAAQVLQQTYGFEVDDIVAIRSKVSETGLKILAEPRAEKLRPSSVYSAQFSLPYSIAIALIDENVGLSSFCEERIGDPEVHRVADRVECSLDEESVYPTYFDGHVEIDLTDGRTVEHRETENRGSATRQLTDAEIIEKFVANLVFTGRDRQEAENLARRCLDGGSFRELTMVLKSSPA